MLLGKIIGKTSTTSFKFSVESSQAQKFEFVQVMHKDHGFILCQIVEIEQDSKGTVGFCNVIGYKESGILKQLRTPLHPGSEVLIAEDDLIKDITKLNADNTALIGTLEGKDIKINLDLNKLLTKHVAILAKTGAGKSYAAGVLVEEILDKKIPLIIIDPHGEYSSMKEKGKEDDRLVELGLKPKGYTGIQEYGDIDISSNVKPLLLNEEMTPKELLTVLPAKLSSAQQAALYAAMKDSQTITLSHIVNKLEESESQNMYNVMSMIEYLRNLSLFSLNYTPYSELIQPGKCSIINLKGIEPEVQEIIVYKILKDLFEMRKSNKVSPFFCLIEEAHNFIPERGTGEKKCSSIIRTLAAEGRKFGLGLCVITQRPARIEKNVLSQCNTQIILKVTNPADVKAISASVEGITSEAEKEIPNLPIGSAIVTGLSDMPLVVNIRPRKSKHDGETVNIMPTNFDEEIKTFQEQEVLPVIDAKVSVKELKLMQEDKKEVQTYLIPALFVTFKGEPSYNILIDKIKGHVIADIAKKEIIPIKDITKLEDYQTFEKISFKQISYDTMLTAKKTTEAIKKKLEILADIDDMQDCYVVHHYAQ